MNSRDSYAVLREKKTAEIEAVLRNYLPQKEGCQKIIMEAMEYSLMAGGKRLRPMLIGEDLPSVWRRREMIIEPFMAAD